MRRNLGSFLQDVCILSSALLSCAALIRAKEYAKGTDVTLTFRHQLRNSTHIFSCNMFVQGISRPFIVDSNFVNEGLTPGQRGRFDFHVDQTSRNLTIRLTITHIDTIDEGVYVLSIVESNGDVIGDIYKAHVHVTYSPGTADCEVQSQPLSGSDWLTVSCNATTGNDGSGYLTCISDSKRLPYRQPVTTDGSVITGEFWIVSSSRVRCCSVKDVSVLPFASCDDFVYIPQVETSLSPHSAERTSTLPINSQTTSGDDASGCAPCNALLWRNITISIMIMLSVVLVILLGASEFTSRKRARRLSELMDEVQHLRLTKSVSLLFDNADAPNHKDGTSCSDKDQNEKEFVTFLSMKDMEKTTPSDKKLSVYVEEMIV